ncbi:hypothetical protein ACKI14_46360 [Streptomyces turgidiscabies]|uniref:hypothetical protein n=1 Tax=Streptomyces turgidiscabies TaxID=85558 RepID=UPI0038F6C062
MSGRGTAPRTDTTNTHRRRYVVMAENNSETVKQLQAEARAEYQRYQERQANARLAQGQALTNGNAAANPDGSCRG